MNVADRLLEVLPGLGAISIFFGVSVWWFRGMQETRMALVRQRRYGPLIAASALSAAFFFAVMAGAAWLTFWMGWNG